MMIISLKYVIVKGDKKISSILGVVYKNMFYYLIPVVYKSEYIKYSPGKFIL